MTNEVNDILIMLEQYFGATFCAKFYMFEVKSSVKKAVELAVTS